MAAVWEDQGLYLSKTPRKTPGHRREPLHYTSKRLQCALDHLTLVHNTRPSTTDLKSALQFIHSLLRSFVTDHELNPASALPQMLACMESAHLLTISVTL